MLRTVILAPGFESASVNEILIKRMFLAIHREMCRAGGRKEKVPVKSEPGRSFNAAIKV